MKEKLPTFLLECLKNQYTESQVEQILEGYSTKRKTTFRVNTLKATKEKVREEFLQNHYEIKEVSWYPNSYLVIKQGTTEITQLECYQKGWIYLQSLSSMLPVLILNPQEKEDILDMAAAPGSKTTQIAMETNNKVHLTACEKDAIRLERLKYNLEKQGVICCHVMKMDARNLDEFFSFDKVLLDAPCSGSGTISLLEDNPYLLTEEKLKKFQQTQISLLRKALKVLKPNQRMIYSTCSILKQENEEVIEAIQKEFKLEILPIDIEDEIPLLKTTIENTKCICPTTEMEGFFLAYLEKK